MVFIHFLELLEECLFSEDTSHFKHSFGLSFLSSFQLSCSHCLWPDKKTSVLSFSMAMVLD